VVQCNDDQWELTRRDEAEKTDQKRLSGRPGVSAGPIGDAFIGPTPAGPPFPPPGPTPTCMGRGHGRRENSSHRLFG